jgi:hypothetical protein
MADSLWLPAILVVLSVFLAVASALEGRLWLAAAFALSTVVWLQTLSSSGRGRMRPPTS